MDTKTEYPESSARRGLHPDGRPSTGMKPVHWIIFLVVCVVLGILVFETVIHVIGTNTSTARHLNLSAPVETVVAERQSLDEVIGGSGAVEQSTTVQLTSQVTAEVLDVKVKVGDIVKKGDLLMSFDARLIEAQMTANKEYVDVSNIKIKDQQKQVDRYTALEKKSMGTPLELEKSEIALADARQDLAKAQLTLRQAEIDLEHVKVTAPLDGIVLERLVNPGESTHRDQIILKLGSLNTILVTPKITEEKMHAVQLGMPAEVAFPAFSGEVFAGKIVKIDPNIDPVTRTFTAYVEVKNDDFRLKPGLSGFARIRRSLKDVLAVPSIAIMNPSGEQATVFVVDGTGHANQRKVKTGSVVNAMTEITSGLQAGENVVTVGQLYLKENDKVHTTSRSKTQK
ncbi:MAG: efflux RND transporter periplasmic adaptor subunit [Chthoniobacterales bacterium]|nr:efflux RND transporter periplasmic adaptor subunit [Chthoniobacterales bacterium]